MKSCKAIDRCKHFSRAGKASQLKFRILLDKDQILTGTKKNSSLLRLSSQPILDHSHSKPVAKTLEDLKSSHKKNDSKLQGPSASFLSPARKEIFPIPKDISESTYQVSYKLVEKSPVFYSMSKGHTKTEPPKVPDTILSTNLHQFPENTSKGIRFKNQTPRKDILLGQPSPHEERFNSHNLIPKSCSKFSFLESPRFGNYAERKEFYIKKEFSPDYRPNKEFVLPRITKNIVFREMTERRKRESEWMCLGPEMDSYEKKAFVEGIGNKKERMSKRSSQIRLPTEFFIDELQEI